MDHLAHSITDNDAIEARNTFIQLGNAEGGLAKWAEPEHEASPEVAAIRLVLNDFELISTSIQFGIMDFDFYRQQNFGTVIRYWKAAAPFIHALRQRTGRQTLYAEFEVLAEWMDKDLRPSRRGKFLRKFF